MIVPSAASAVIVEAVRQTLPIDDERVVAGRLQRVGQAGEDALAVVADPRGLAVHELGRGDDAPAVDVADGLVAQADPEHRQPLRRRGGDERLHDAGVLRPAGTR